MDFNINMRYNRIACMIMFAIFAWTKGNVIAQTACVVETVFPVSIQSKPTAAFGFLANGLSATFSNSSVNGITYSWDFGDPGSGSSNTSLDANPIHQFTAPGNYTVTLTAMNGCGSKNVTQTVQVACPTLAVTAAANGPTQICPGTSVVLMATPGFQNYQWLLGGNPIANSNAANFTASPPGEYTVGVTDAAGCMGTSQGVLVELLPLAEPSFSTTVNALSAAFVNTSAHSTTYTWDFGDPNSGASNTSSETNPTHIFSAPGTYTVTLTASNSCGQQSITQIVQPGCPPVAVTAAANGSTQICPGTSVVLMATPGFQNYQWLLDGNPIANSTAANFTASVAGEYTVAVTDAAGCVGTSQGVLVELLPLAEPSFSTTINALSAAFVNTSANSTTYSWDFGDPNSGASNTSSETNPIHNFSAPGTYLVTLTATNACGNQNTIQTVVIACTPPQVNIASNSPLNFCEGSSTTLQAAPTNLAAYQWYLNDLPIPSGTSPAFVATAAGEYKVLVSDIFGCENYSDVLVLTVNPIPLVSISGIASDYKESDPPVPLIGTPAGGIFSGNGLVVGDLFDPGAAGVGQHTIYYEYTDANNCANKDSVVVNVTMTISASNLTGVIGDIQVFPNPNHGEFWLKMVLSSDKTLNFGLVNALGQTVTSRQESMPSGLSILHFSNNEMLSGVYFLSVLDREQHACIRVIVTK